MTPEGKNAQYWNAAWTEEKVKQELDVGLALLNEINRPIVTFFGSARVKQDNPYYKHCKEVGYELGKRNFAVISGGGPGIMEAANTGAKQAGTISIGFQAGLIKNEKVQGSPFTHTVRFRFLFVRRFVLAIKSDVLIVYPGGFGTLNELFEYVCLMQTSLVDRVPIILVDRKYWQGMKSWIESTMISEGMINPADMALLNFVDTKEEILRIVEQAQSSKL